MWLVNPPTCFVQGQPEERFYYQTRTRIACTLISNGAFVDAENASGRTFMRYGSSEITDAVQSFMDEK